MKSKIKRALIELFGGYIKFIKAEIRAHKRIPALKKFPFMKRLRCFLKGFNTDKLVFYKNFADDLDGSLYISDIERLRDCEKLCGPAWFIANDKLIFERLFKSKVNCVLSIGFVENNNFYFENKPEQIRSLEDLIHELALTGKSLYLKPKDGGSGRGIMKATGMKTGVRCKGKEYSEEEFISFLQTLNGYIIQNEFKQIGFSHDIYPGTLNSIRVATAMDPSTGKPFVMHAFHRFGTEGIEVDNVASGGLFAPADVHDGRLHALRPYPTNGAITYTSCHPNTGVQVEGVCIPNWNEITSTVIELHEYIPFFAICGWDVILTGDGEIYIQELNYNPDTNIGQMDEPALVNEQTRRFYKHYIKGGVEK